jgi:MFS superfamily sulfate permease-like transporter
VQIAGLMLVVMGLTKMGTVIKFIPAPLIVGFTSGIAVIIFVGQWKEFLGLPAVPGGAVSPEAAATGGGAAAVSVGHHRVGVDESAGAVFHRAFAA